MAASPQGKIAYPTVQQQDRTIVGAAERVDLPDWGVRLRAKIDTGAKTSALHVDDVEELPNGRVKFAIVTSRRTRARKVHVIAKVVRRTKVRSSTGQSEDRIVVATTLALGGVEKKIEVTLSSRGEMIFRMLLGRGALADDFLVDPGHRYLHGRPPKPKKDAVKKTASRTRRATTRRRSKKTTRRRVSGAKAKATVRTKRAQKDTGS